MQFCGFRSPLTPPSSIPYSLALRLRRICSNHDNYIMRTTELIDYLVRRGYDKTFLKTQIQRASDVPPRTDALKNKPRIETETIPFVITYNPALPNIARIIHQHSNVLYSSDRCRNVFKNRPLVAHRRCKNISDILAGTHRQVFFSAENLTIKGEVHVV